MQRISETLASQGRCASSLKTLTQLAPSMATPADKFLADYEGVCAFLTAQSEVLGAGAAKVQEAQAKSLALKMSGLCLTPGEAAKITSAIAGGPWTPEQKSTLANSVGASLEGIASSGRRRESQVLNTFSPYLRAADLAVLRSSAGLHAKLQCCVDLCAGIGLILPTEPSIGVIVKTITALGHDALRDPKSFLAAATEFKRLHRAQTKHIRNDVHLTEYPSDPKQLPPALKAIYAQEGPAGLELVLQHGSAPLRRSALAVRDASTVQGQASPMVAMWQMMQMVMKQQQSQQQWDSGSALGNLEGLKIFQPPAKQAALLPAAAGQPQESIPVLQAASPPETALPPTASLATASMSTPALQHGEPLTPEAQADLMMQAFQNRSAPEEKRAGKAAAAVAKPKAKAKGKAKAKAASKASAKSSRTKPCAKAKLRKDPTVAGLSREEKLAHYRAMALPKRRLLRPEGCKKCRGKVGCTPSCFV